jgi:uncharacterized protein
MSVGPVLRDAATAEFFDGTAAGQFLLMRCAAGHVSEPAVAQCTTCGDTDLAWVPASGGATLVSWAVSYGRAADGPTADGPTADLKVPAQTVLAIGELDEGPWWWAQLDGDGGELSVGRRLRIEFRRAGAGEYEAVPVFVLA